MRTLMRLATGTPSGRAGQAPLTRLRVDGLPRASFDLAARRRRRCSARYRLRLLRRRLGSSPASSQSFPRGVAIGPATDSLLHHTDRDAPLTQAIERGRLYDNYLRFFISKMVRITIVMAMIIVPTAIQNSAVTI